MTYELREGEYTASDDASRVDLDYVHNFLTNSYWSRSIPRDLVQRAIANSLPFVLLDANRTQCGFARVISDRATYAYIADVFVDEAHRGHGLGKLLMKTILSHPELQGLRRWMLATRDAHGLYKQFGFVEVTRPEWHMEIVVPDIYTRGQ